MNVLDLWRSEFKSKKWFDCAESVRQIFEERVASCYDSESSHIKIACKEYDLEKDYVDPRIEGRCSMFNNCEIMAFLKLLKRPPAWAKADLPRLKNVKDIHPLLREWWLPSGD